MAASMLQANPKDPGTYTYSSQPRVVQQEKLYRTENSGYGNIMYDKRVVRGNTYALHTMPASSQTDPLELQRQQESRRRALARQRAHEQFKPRSPDAVEGRKHIEVQTELYLEEITDRIEEADVLTQTDAFLDRPPTPLFIPAKTGLDAATQIQEGDLFDFDLEVKPILEVLVGKTIEQSLVEVMEEEELASLRAQQCLFEENRNAELVETQRLQEQERRRRQEKERRMKQQRNALLKEKETAEKVAARAFAQSYLSDLVPSVFSTLNQNGFFYDPVEREVESIFMPWLMRQAEKALDEKILARMVLDALIRDTVHKMLEAIKTPRISVPANEEPITPTIPEPEDEPLLKVVRSVDDDVSKAKRPPSPVEEEKEEDVAEDDQPSKSESVSLGLPAEHSESVDQVADPPVDSESSETPAVVDTEENGTANQPEAEAEKPPDTEQD